MKNNVRQVEFDLLKGIGILFVILGHSVPDFPVNLRADMLSSTVKQVMYAFHRFFAKFGGNLFFISMVLLHIPFCRYLIGMTPSKKH